MFDRLLKIINSKDYQKLKSLKVLLVGIGGVGGYTLEALVRMGIGSITIVDYDTIEESNLNRQIVALHSNIGKLKVDVAKDRSLDINPNIDIKTISTKLAKDNLHILNITDYDYIIDACDTVTVKVELIKQATLNNIKIISCMGTGNRFNPTKLEITDISKTYNDPLAKILRKLLKEAGIKHTKVVFSKETPIKTHEKTPGSTSLVPSTAGILLASYVINDALNKPI